MFRNHSLERNCLGQAGDAAGQIRKGNTISPVDSIPIPDVQVSRGFLWKTRAKLFGIPIVCIAFGTDERGKILVAKGFLAIGQFAVGVIAIGQFGLGIVSLCQVALGVIAAAQLGVGLLAGFGQIAIGTFAVGQLVVGEYARGQLGWAAYLWSPYRTDLEAVAMFESIEWLFKQDVITILEKLWFMTKISLAKMFSFFW